MVLCCFEVLCGVCVVLCCVVLCVVVCCVMLWCGLEGVELSSEEERKVGEEGER